MAAPKNQTIKPVYFALACAAAVAIMFLGSIAIGVAVVQAERSAPAGADAGDAQ